MKTAVVGCGGNGGVIAAALALNGLDPVCITGRKESARQLNGAGITARGSMGNFNVPVRAHSLLKESSGEFDIIFIAVKSTDLRSAFQDAKDHLGENGIIAAVQNGLGILGIAKEFPDVHIAAGAVGYNSVMLDYGRYRVNSKGGIVFGPLNGAGTGDLGAIKKCLEPCIKISYSCNTEGMLWAKLIIVCGVTGLGGASGLVTGKLMKIRAARELFYRIVDEGAAVVDALGIRIEKLPGSINPIKFGSRRGGLPLFVRYLLLRIIGIRYRNLKSNIHHSIERGKKTEIDFINGALVEAGENAGIPTPVNNAVVRLVHEIESGVRTMDVRNLYDISRSE